jgi:hypothetical protein
MRDVVVAVEAVVKFEYALLADALELLTSMGSPPGFRKCRCIGCSARYEKSLPSFMTTSLDVLYQLGIGLYWEYPAIFKVL